MSMRAAVITAYGEPPTVIDTEPPEASDEAELVEVEIAGLNPVDIAIASGKFDLGAPPLPYVTGKEAVGLTADGRRIWFDESRHPSGSLAEITAINRNSGIELPDGMPADKAIAFGIAGMAAWLSLEWRGGLQAGETVIINGASGAVGQIALQASRLLGAEKVVATARSESGRQKALALGADAVVDTGSDDLSGDLFEATGGGADLVMDGLWGSNTSQVIKAIKGQGRLVQVGNAAGTDAEILAGPLRGGLIDIRGFRNFWAPREKRVEAFLRMCRHCLAGELEIEVEVLDLEDAADAWARQQASPGHKLALSPR